MSDECNHDLYEQETACADGFCPICATAEIVRLKGEAENWEKVFDRTCEHLAEAKEELNDRRKFAYAVEQALDGLKGDYVEIISALRKDAAIRKGEKESLTVAEQEPVAWMSDSDVGFYKEEFGNYPCVPLYTAPPAAQPSQEPMHPEIKKMYEDYFDKCFRESSTQQRQWVALTEDEITKLHHEIKTQLMGTYKTEDIYRAIEAKLREKNT